MCIRDRGRNDLKGFYPRGTKDELTYYSQQFNSIEMNSLFYNMPKADQVVKWKNRTPDGFRFFPKINQVISHTRRLENVEDLTTAYCDAIAQMCIRDRNTTEHKPHNSQSLKGKEGCSLYPLKFKPILKSLIWGGSDICKFKKISPVQELSLIHILAVLAV